MIYLQCIYLTILGALGCTIVPWFARLTICKVVITDAGCYGTRGAGLRLVTALWTIVTNRALGIGRVGLNGTAITVETGKKIITCISNFVSSPTAEPDDALYPYIYFLKNFNQNGQTNI